MKKKKYQKPSMEEYKMRERVKLLQGTGGGGTPDPEGSGYIPGHNIKDDMNHLA